MKLFKPEWVCHEGKAIFAIDIHPDGSRFATGGQGDDTGLVIIWNTTPIINELYENDENVPRRLCQMDDHIACVNCLRWSNSGKYLATGGDDKMVMIWGMSRASASTVFGTGGSVVNIENWKCANILRSHSGDILDLAWSPDDSYLATGSVDNTIRIWNAQKFPEVIHIIDKHEGLVKGVTFDPVGKYFASQSDDKSLCIWNTRDWSLETKITEPFMESSGTTHALRLNWSPDGQYLVSAHAMNNGGPVAKIVERNGWKTKMDFVGHRKAVTCVRFNERLLTTTDATKAQYVCCAVGSRDRSLSVWLTSLKRPLVVINELFENSVMDITWSHCGYFLLVCSLDGSVAYMHFNKEELGSTMSKENKYIYHKKTYGTSIKASKSLILSSVLENPDFLKQQQKQQAEMVKKAKLLQQNYLSSSSGMVSPVGKFASTPFKGDVKHAGGLASSSSTEKLEASEILKKQKEVKTKEGKRRIVPMLLEPPPDLSNDAVFVDFNAEQKKSDLAESFGSNFMSGISSHQSTTPRKLSVSESKTDVSMENGSTTTITNIPIKRKLEIPVTTPSKKSKKKKEKEKEKSTKEAGLTPVKSTSPQPEKSQSFNAIHLPYPEPAERLSLQVNLKSFKQNDEKATLEVENHLQEPCGFHYLRCILNDTISWECCFTQLITAIAANAVMVCVSCKDHSVHIFSTKGRRLLPPLVVDASVSQMQCHKQFLMVLTSSAIINMWDIKEKKCLMKGESLLPLFKGSSQSITQCFINASGCPVIILSDHTVYSYDINFCTWTLLASSNDPLQLSADTGSCIVGTQPKGYLHSIQAPLQRLSKHVTRGLRLNQTKQQTNTISYLDAQVTKSLSIHSPEEYHFWLMTYTRYIVQSDDESKLRELCEDLLGPVHTAKKCDWKSKILCYEKRELLKDILPIIASNLRFQRFYTEIQQQLEVVTKR